jgi:tetratricopeptide (TPR) repeat protein
MTGLFAAGWVAGRGPLEPAAATAGPPPLAAVRASLPGGRTLARRLVGGAAVLLAAAVGAFAIAGPWHSDRKGDEALRLLAQNDFAGARAAAEDAKDINPLSVDPYFERAVIEDAAGRRRAALGSLEDAVRLEPARPEAWRRLGDYYLDRMSDPDRAIPVLRAAVFLDPFSQQSRSTYVIALRARRLKSAELALQRRRAARRAASRAAARGGSPGRH